jgi:hypothetical protein
LILIIPFFPCFSGPEIRGGDNIAISVNLGWVLLHEDGTWEPIPIEKAPNYLFLNDPNTKGVPALDNKDPETWSYYSGKDEMTDEEWHVFSTYATESSTRYGDKPAIRLYIMEDGRSNLVLDWEEYIGSSATVTWRLDTEPAVTEAWPLSKAGTFTWFPGDEKEWITRLLKKKRIVARVTRYDGRVVSATFDLEGLHYQRHRRPELFELAFEYIVDNSDK